MDSLRTYRAFREPSKQAVFEGGGVTVGHEIKGVRHPASSGAWTVVAPLQLDEILSSVILSGVPERHPKLKLVLGESGIGWLPYILERRAVLRAQSSS